MVADLEGTCLKHGTSVYVPLQHASDAVRRCALSDRLKREQSKVTVWGRAVHDHRTGRNVLELGAPGSRGEWWVRRGWLQAKQPDLDWAPWCIRRVQDMLRTEDAQATEGPHVVAQPGVAMVRYPIPTADRRVSGRSVFRLGLCHLLRPDAMVAISVWGDLMCVAQRRGHIMRRVFWA